MKVRIHPKLFGDNFTVTWSYPKVRDKEYFGGVFNTLEEAEHFAKYLEKYVPIEGQGT